MPPGPPRIDNPDCTQLSICPATQLPIESQFASCRQNIHSLYGPFRVSWLPPPPPAGALYSYVGSTIVDGFGACLMVSVGFAALSCAIDLFLHDDHTGGEQSYTGHLLPGASPPHLFLKSLTSLHMPS